MNSNNTRKLHINLNIPLFVFLVFLVLKITHVIDWSWWWVTCPLWIIALYIIFWVMIVVLTQVIANFAKNVKANRESREWLNSKRECLNSKMGPALIWDCKTKEFINGPKIPHNNDTNDTND